MAILQTIPAGDIKLQNGDFATVSGSELARQKLAARFKFFLGEWFLDQRQGLPYYRDVFKKNPDLGVIRSVFRRVVLDCPGIVGIRKFELKFDHSARELSFDFTAIATDGALISVAPSDRLFIVRV